MNGSTIDVAALVRMATLPASAQAAHNGLPAVSVATPVIAPAGAATLYVAGMLADPARPDGDHGDAETQTRSVTGKPNAELATTGLEPREFEARAAKTPGQEEAK